MTQVMPITEEKKDTRYLCHEVLDTSKNFRFIDLIPVCAANATNGMFS
jgi:hypothetical protein